MLGALQPFYLHSVVSLELNNWLLCCFLYTHLFYFYFRVSIFQWVLKVFFKNVFNVYYILCGMCVYSCECGHTCDMACV